MYHIFTKKNGIGSFLEMWMDLESVIQKVKSLSRVQLCDPMNCSPPGSSVHGILQQKYWRGVPSPSPGDLPDPGIEPASLVPPAWAGGFFTTAPPGLCLSPTRADARSRREDLHPWQRS